MVAVIRRCKQLPICSSVQLLKGGGAAYLEFAVAWATTLYRYNSLCGKILQRVR